MITITGISNTFNGITGTIDREHAIESCCLDESYLCCEACCALVSAYSSASGIAKYMFRKAVTEHMAVQKLAISSASVALLIMFAKFAPELHAVLPAAVQRDQKLKLYVAACSKVLQLQNKKAVAACAPILPTRPLLSGHDCRVHSFPETHIPSNFCYSLNAIGLNS